MSLQVAEVVIALLGFLLAAVQTLRHRAVKREADQLRRIRNASIWAEITRTLHAYESLEDARGLVPEDQPALAAKISSARRSVVSQYVELLKEAALDEERFSEDTIQRWISQGRLENEWRAQQARRFIPPESRE